MNRRETHVERARKAPLAARIAAGVIVGAVALGGFAACGAFVAQSGKASECRAELEQVLAEAGSDRPVTDAEVQACLAK